MTPTRELALQTTKECRKFAKFFDLRCVAVYGGTGISEQIVRSFQNQISIIDMKNKSFLSRLN